MKTIRLIAAALALVLVPFAGLTALAQEAVLVTSSGQALDAFTVKTLLGRAGLANDYDPHATADDLAGRKAVVIAVGASVKGFGAAGITAETELARTTALLDKAKADGIKVIGVHIGGAERRQGLSEQFIQLVSPRADALVVWKAGNEDGYFDKVAADNNIPLTVVNSLAEAAPAIAKVIEGQE